jgi:hypothetical protein
MNPTFDSRGRIRLKPRMKVREFHGMARTRLYYVWRDMRRRCYFPRGIAYRWYMGKGICVCEEWFNSFLAFKEWALANRYADNLTIDRKDSSKDYSPDNCQWLTRSENTSKATKGHRRERKTS